SYTGQVLIQSMMEILGIWFFAIIVPWSIASWLRVIHYARFYQLEGYDSKRFIRWLWTNPTERRSLLIDGVITLVYPFVVIVFITYTMQGEIIHALVNLLIVVGVFVLQPRSREIKQKFTPTQRAIRLNITVIILAGLPILIAPI